MMAVPILLEGFAKLCDAVRAHFIQEIKNCSNLLVGRAFVTVVYNLVLLKYPFPGRLK